MHMYFRGFFSSADSQCSTELQSGSQKYSFGSVASLVTCMEVNCLMQIISRADLWGMHGMIATVKQ